MVNLQAEESSKEDEPFGLGCALDYFVEYEEVLQMIDNLKILPAAERSVQEKAYEKFSFILSQYIEQPHLLDTHIDSILEKFIDIIRNNTELQLKHLACNYMFVVVNVRGYKDIVKHLPHEVADFEPVLHFLEDQDPNDPDTWTTRYILLLWLSIIIMIPFHLSRFDGFDESSEKTSVMNRVLSIIKMYAVVPDKCRDAAAFLSYKFINRTDVKERHLIAFFEWVMQQSLAKDSNVFTKYGTLACIAMIIKHGKREDILPHARNLLGWIINSEFKESSGTSVQKLVYKIVQRIGLTFLQPRIVSWRYQRGNRCLASNLNAAGDPSHSISTDPQVDDQDTDDQIDIPDEVEEVIDQLIQGLRCGDSVVRWSAAKGLGRITARLPQSLADEVVGSILELLGPRDNDAAWHGGCIALAELGRRGLLRPERLPQVVPLILKALIYDEPKGYSSVGSHIRDAACYVCWSFARAYDPVDLVPYVQDIASTLLVVTCFDKEINCRRAASAAFQENVGRQGTFPHGIDILVMADFYAVSVRNNSYLTISVFIAQYQEYTIPLIDHLVNRKVDHWDCSIRELATKALHNLTPLAPYYMIDKILPNLFEKTESIDLNSRHGAVLAIGQIVYGLSLMKNAENVALPETIQQEIRTIIKKYRESHYLLGLGGELMKQACSDFIEKCSLAKLPFHKEEVPDDWLNLLNDCLSHEVVNVRQAAVDALPVLLDEYFASKEREEFIKNILKMYEGELKQTVKQAPRMGHALALGSLPKRILARDCVSIIDALIAATYPTQNTAKWAQSRRDAVKALTLIVTTMEDELGQGLNTDSIINIMEAFFAGLKDYTQDKRGDIGAWVREACVTGLQVLTLNLSKRCPNLLHNLLVDRILSNIAQQAVEKIDRTRALSGKAFFSLLYNEPPVPNISFHDKICEIFPKSECEVLNWNSASATFPKFVQLLQFPPYRYTILVGLVCSVGGLTESLVKWSSIALFNYLKEKEKTDGSTEIENVCGTTLQIFKDYQKQDRITVPLFRFLDKMFDSGCLAPIIDSTVISTFLKLIQVEILGCKDIYKLIDGISILSQFIQVPGDVCKKALVQLGILLCHRQPYVRRSTAAKLYESLLVNGDSCTVPPENLDEIMQIVSDTNWESSIEEIKPIRNNLCGLMDVRVPTTVKK